MAASIERGRRRRFFRERSAAWIVLAAALCAAGCGESTTAEVSGTVAVDGEPAKMGSISFFPVDGKGATAGTEIADGRYTAEVPFGEKKVEIRVSKVVGRQKLYDTPDSPVQDVLDEVLPDKYNNQTELRLNVTPGRMTKDYELSTE